MNWADLSGMYLSRVGHTATLLPDGRRVVIAGGVAGGSPVQLATIEAYDVTTGAVFAYGHLNHARSNHTATPVYQDSILIAGGSSASVPFRSDCEIYSTTTYVGQPTARMHCTRMMHTATRLQHGGVLVVGGFGTGTHTPELFVEATSSWTVLSDTTVERYGHTATLLADGRVLVVGGVNSNNVLGRGDCEIYDPSSQTWTATASLIQARAHHTATLLPDGRVVVAGGTNGPNVPLSAAEIYDPVQQAWAALPPMNYTRVGHTADFLNGHVFVVGGGETGGAGEYYDQSSNIWRYRGILTPARGYHTSTVLFTPPNPWLYPLSTLAYATAR